MVEVNAEYLGDLRCKAVHGPSGQVLITDAPADNQGKGESFSPTDLLGTSLITCMLTIMGIAARKNNIDITGGDGEGAQGNDGPATAKGADPYGYDHSAAESD